MPAKTVSDEIRHLMGEKGYAQDRAVAAALSQWRGGKLTKTAKCDRLLREDAKEVFSTDDEGVHAPEPEKRLVGFRKNIGGQGPAPAKAGSMAKAGAGGPPRGFAPIPGSKHGGFRKKSRGEWVYWYPGGTKTHEAAGHHNAQADAIERKHGVTRSGYPKADKKEWQEHRHAANAASDHARGGYHYDVIVAKAQGADMNDLQKAIAHLRGDDDLEKAGDWQPIPGGRKGGQRKKVGGKWQYRYGKDSNGAHGQGQRNAAAHRQATDTGFDAEEIAHVASFSAKELENHMQDIDDPAYRRAVVRKLGQRLAESRPTDSGYTALAAVKTKLEVANKVEGMVRMVAKDPKNAMMAFDRWSESLSPKQSTAVREQLEGMEAGASASQKEILGAMQLQMGEKGPAASTKKSQGGDMSELLDLVKGGPARRPTEEPTTEVQVQPAAGVLDLVKGQALPVAGRVGRMGSVTYVEAGAQEYSERTLPTRLVEAARPAERQVVPVVDQFREMVRMGPEGRLVRPDHNMRGTNEGEG